MGQSTDAYLIYGYIWDDEESLLPEDFDGDDWVEMIAEREGVPVVDYSDYPEQDYNIRDYREREAQYRPRYEAWRLDNKSVIEARDTALTEIKQRYGGVTLDSHCSCECPMPMVHYEPWELRASRGYPQRVPQTIDIVGQHRVDVLINKFMEDLEIEYPDGQDNPAWWLASMWC